MEPASATHQSRRYAAPIPERKPDAALLIGGESQVAVTIFIGIGEIHHEMASEPVTQRGTGSEFRIVRARNLELGAAVTQTKLQVHDRRETASEGSGVVRDPLLESGLVFVLAFLHAGIDAEGSPAAGEVPPQIGVCQRERLGGLQSGRRAQADVAAILGRRKGRGRIREFPPEIEIEGRRG
jgi:hypothetical protein